MRVAFVGKGGSGKTTIAAAFAKYMAKKQFVLAIDADINVNMKDMLSLVGSPILLGEHFKELSNYVKGDRVDLKNTTMICTTPPSLQSKFIIPSKNDDFIQKYGLHGDNISLISVGTFESGDIGHSCYHGKLNSIELFLHHLLDTDKDVVIADATTGIDSFGTSLYFAYDLNVFVVEPTKKSVGVFNDFKELAEKAGVSVYAVANKIQGSEDVDFIKKNVGNVIAIIPESRNVSLHDQGDSDSFEKFIVEVSPELEKMEKLLFSKRKDWTRYYNLLLENHEKRAKGWYDEYYNQNISGQKDEEFSYEKVVGVKQ